MSRVIREASICVCSPHRLCFGSTQQSRGIGGDRFPHQGRPSFLGQSRRCLRKGRNKKKKKTLLGFISPRTRERATDSSLSGSNSFLSFRRGHANCHRGLSNSSSVYVPSAVQVYVHPRDLSAHATHLTGCRCDEFTSVPAR